MFIANTTRQHHRFAYRLPEGNKVLIAEINSGGQLEIGQDFTPEQISAVVRQLERFGAREAKDARRSLRDFDGGILYSIDKPITRPEIEYAHEQNLDSAQDRSVRQATRAALASDQRDKKTGKRLSRATTVEVEEKDDPSNPHVDSGKKRRKVKMSVTIDPTAPEKGDKLPV